ncbi:MAG: tetratricopeptide repeat protein [Candidatus Acidiferrales bacterium]
MTRPLICLSVFTLVISAAFSRPASETSAKPLGASELLALVAGGTQTENVVHEISADGLAFRPDDFYGSLLKKAGATDQVLAALDAARIVGDRSPEADSGKDLLQHLANAAALMNDRHYPEAAAELTSALSLDVPCTECGFVMGQVLRLQEKWTEAAAVYQEVLVQDPDFPDVHTRLAYVLNRSGDFEGALREAKAALAVNPDDAEAHRTAGGEYVNMQQYDAAEPELREALRLKPDYGAARRDLGALYANQGNHDDAIPEFKKAIVLNPNDIDAHNYLGSAYQDKGDFASAIREFREAKRIDPTQPDARQNLASALIKNAQYGEAITEFRELESMFPDSAICHACLGNALLMTWDLPGAEAELEIAIKLDPAEPFPHISLGAVRETQKNYDAALKEYREALSLDDTSMDAYRGTGRVLIAQKNFADAVEVLKQAESLNPGDASIHDLLGQALLGTGDFSSAIDEFRQCLALKANQSLVMLELAEALEKKGEWPDALVEYHRAAAAYASQDPRTTMIRPDDPNPVIESKAAQARFDAYIAALKAAGKSDEAASLQARLQSVQAPLDPSEELDEALQAGVTAARARNFPDATQDFARAVAIADQLHPHDQRLITALNYLANMESAQDYAGSQALLERELQVSEEIYGAQSLKTAAPLEALAMNAMFHNDKAVAEKFYTNAVEVNERAFGANGEPVADALVYRSRIYFPQQLDKAETDLLRALNIEQSLYAADDMHLATVLGSLADLYDLWGKPDKSEAADHQLIAILEKQFGPADPILARPLASEAKALRSLGRTDEAAAIEQRLNAIEQSTAKTN